MNYVKRDSCKTVKEVVERNTKMTVDKLLNPKRDPYLTNLKECVEKIKEAIKDKKKINIIADYDCDGITSAAILFLAFSRLGSIPFIRIPKRFSEGYGVSENIIDEIKEGLLITVDNGISATEAIKKAKDKGLDVVIIDHHLSETIPCADVVLNPHVTDGNEFVDYCGAGLAYRVCKELLKADNNYDDFVDKLAGLAAIGTIADVMPLTGDNRNVVIDGIKAINDCNVTSGLQALLTLLKNEKVDEGFIGFNLAPIINATGRLEDSGAKTVFRLLASESDDKDKLSEIAQTLINNNNRRKVLVEEAVEKVDLLLKKDDKLSNSPAIVLNISANEGIVGIIAGKLAEKYRKPCIVFTKTDAGLKGSGRCPEGINLKEILDKCSDLLIKYGGHAGAAGLLIAEQNFEVFSKRFSNEVKNSGFSSELNTIYFDLEISQNEVNDVYEEIKKYAPYGMGNEPILFKIKDFVPTQKFGKKFTVMGLNHLKIFGKENDVIAFNFYNKFSEIKEKEKWDIIGDMLENNYNGKTTVQIKAIDVL